MSVEPHWRRKICLLNAYPGVRNTKSVLHAVPLDTTRGPKVLTKRRGAREVKFRLKSTVRVGLHGVCT